MDGLLIDTEAVYLAAYLAAAAHMKVELPLAFCHSLIGRPSPDCDRMIQEYFGPAFALDAFNDHDDGHAGRALQAKAPGEAGGRGTADVRRRARPAARGPHLFQPADHRASPRPGRPARPLPCARHAR